MNGGYTHTNAHLHQPTPAPNTYFYRPASGAAQPVPFPVMQPFRCQRNAGNIGIELDMFHEWAYNSGNGPT